MRALVANPDLVFSPNHPKPGPASGESIVRVSLAGICGTDLEITRGYMNYRGVPGHEFVGRVEESEHESLRGRRVVGEINASCGRCSFCRSALGRHCKDRTVMGILGRDGAFADYLRLPDENLVAVPDSVPDELAVFTEPLAAAYEIIEQVHFARDRSVLILGDGRLGAMVALVLNAEDHDPLIAGHHPEKLDRLRSLGFVTEMEGDIRDRFDYVIDCTGHSKGLKRAIELVTPRGTLILKSTAAADASLNLAPVVINEIQVIGSRCGRFGPALVALIEGKVDPRPLIDGTFALPDGAAAFTAAAAPSAFKILLNCA